MKKRSSLGTLRNKCDKVTQLIGHKENEKCLLCPRPHNVLHHFFPKSVSSALRYNFDNLINLCNGCHMRLHQSGDPSYEQRIIAIKGVEWYNNLASHARDYTKINKGYYEDTLVVLQRRLES